MTVMMLPLQTHTSYDISFTNLDHPLRYSNGIQCGSSCSVSDRIVRHDLVVDRQMLESKW